MKRTNKRKEAQDLGLTRYSTGKPCRRGHTAPRNTASGNCVTCASEKAKLRAAVPGVQERINANARKRRKQPEIAEQLAAHGKALRRKDPRYHMLVLAKRRAKRKGVYFELRLCDIVVPSHCPALGIPLFVGDGYSSQNSPTLDRYIPSMGYVPGNVGVISALANSIKQNATPEQIQAVAKWALTVWPEHLR